MQVAWVHVRRHLVNCILSSWIRTVIGTPRTDRKLKLEKRESILPHNKQKIWWRRLMTRWATFCFGMVGMMARRQQNKTRPTRLLALHASHSTPICSPQASLCNFRLDRILESHGIQVQYPKDTYHATPCQCYNLPPEGIFMTAVLRPSLVLSWVYQLSCENLSLEPIGLSAKLLH